MLLDSALRTTVMGRRSIPLLPLGSTFVIAGDSKVDLSSGPGLQNMGQQALDQLTGRLRWASSGAQGKSGNTVAQLQARAANIIAQKPDILVAAIGHNSMNVGTLLADLDTLRDTFRTGLPNSIIIWTTVLPSYCSDGSLYPADNATLLSVNDHIMAYNGRDRGYTKALSFGYRSTDPVLFDPQTMCYPQPATSPVQYIHPNEVGGAFCGAILRDFLSPLVAAQTYLAALQDTGAAREHGANLDGKYAMAGTETVTPFAGSGSGSCSGSVPLNYTVTNNTTATVVSTIITASDGISKAIQLDITGTVTTESNITVGGKNATAGKISVSGVAGDYFESLCGYKLTHTNGSSASVGLFNWGLILPSSVAGLSMNNSATATTQILAAQTAPRGFCVARTYPRSIQSFVAGIQLYIPAFGVRLLAGTVNLRIIYELPITRKTEVVAYAAPAYLGADTIHGSSEQLNLVSGTVANGNVLTFRPGAESGGGGGAMFKTLRLYQASTNTSTGTGTGSLLATVDVSTGTWTWTASGLTSLWFLYPEADANNGIGGIVTTRGAAISIP